LKNKSLYLPLLALAACIPCGAQEPATKELQPYSVLRASRLVTASETLTNADANCAIGGTARDATMQCHSAGGTAKASYHFNTALVLDGKGTAYVIACRLSLVSWWCKTLESGAVLRGNFENGHMALSDGQKMHDYQVLISKYVGPATSPATSTQTATPEQPAAVGAQSRSERTEPTIPARKETKNPGSNQSNPAAEAPTCMSYTGACVSFVSEPLGAEVYVDNKFVGNTPSTLTLAAGSHEIRVEAQTLKPWSRTFEAVAGSKITIRATLEPLPNEK
jgi:PEGA domain